MRRTEALSKSTDLLNECSVRSSCQTFTAGSNPGGASNLFSIPNIRYEHSATLAPDANRLQYIDDFDERCDTFEKRVPPFPTHVAIELRRMQFLNQFTQRFHGRNELRICDRLV